MGELGLDEHFKQATREIIASDPAGFVRRLARASLAYVGPVLDRSRDVWLHRFALLALLPALLWPAWRRRLALPAMVWVGEGLFAVPIAMFSRYRFPSEWCVIVAAAVGLEAVASRWGPRRMGAMALAALLLCIGFTLAVAKG